jgi:peptide/nickel transport system substrate-binding protein
MAAAQRRPDTRRGHSPGALTAAVAIVAILAATQACRARLRPASTTLVLPIPEDILTLDPHAQNLLSNFNMVSNIYEPLVQTDAAMRIVPCLARRWENPDPSTWVFRLQPNVRFHDGRRLEAQDVVASFERLLASPRLQMSGYLLYVTGVRALDPETVEIRTTRPLAIFLNKLRFILIVPRDATEESLKQSPDGTGPYRFVSWKKGVSIELARFDGYWGKRPAVERVAIPLNRPEERSVENLLAGVAHLVRCDKRASQNRLAAVSGIVVRHQTSIFMSYLAFDTDRAVTPFVAGANPFRLPAVREAIDLAIDREALAAALPTRATAATQAVPPFIFGYEPRIPPPRHDAAAAKAKLAQAGYPAGFDVTLHTRESSVAAAERVRQDLAAIGVRVQIVSEAVHDFYERALRREFSIALASIGCPTGDASDILDNSFHTIDARRHFGLHNYTGYGSPELDSAIEKSAELLDPVERREALQAILSRIAADRPWIPLAIDESSYGIDARYAWTPRSDSLVLAAEIARKAIE